MISSDLQDTLQAAFSNSVQQQSSWLIYLLVALVWFTQWVWESLEAPLLLRWELLKAIYAAYKQKQSWKSLRGVGADKGHWGG